MLGINWTKIFQPLVPLASLSVPPSCSPILVRPFYFDLLDLLCNLTSIDLPLKKVRRQLNCQDMILYWQYYSHSCVCFVIRYVTLRYVMFCYVLLCYVMLRYVTLRYVTFCYVLLCFVMFCYVTLRYVTLRYVTLRYVTLRYVTLCYVMLFIFVVWFVRSSRTSQLSLYLHSLSLCSFQYLQDDSLTPESQQLKGNEKLIISV